MNHRLERGIIIKDSYQKHIIGVTNGVSDYERKLAEYQERFPNRWLQLKLYRQYRELRNAKHCKK